MSTTESASPKEPHGSVKTSRWKRWTKKLALLAATLSLLAVGAEVATRLFTDTVPPLIVKDLVIGRRYRPSFDGTVYVAESDRKIRLRFSRAGFRGPDRPMEKPPGVCRVAILGDSMISAIAVDEEDTMVCRLEQMLHASHPELKWEVLNFGISGSSPGQEMVLYRELVRQWDPDVVLCAFFAGNDLTDNSHRMSNNPRIYFDLDEGGELRQLPFSAGGMGAADVLNRYSRFYVWQRVAFNATRHAVMKQASILEPGQWIFCRKEPEKVAHAWKLADAVNRAFCREVTGRGGRFAVVMIPSAWQVYEDAFQAVVDRAGEHGPSFDWDHPDQRMAALCREAGIGLLSITADFRKAAPSATTEVKQERLFFRKIGHFNEKGHLVAARAVHRFLTRGSPHLLAGNL